MDVLLLTAGSSTADIGTPSASMLFQMQNSGIAVGMGGSFGAASDSAVFVALNSL